MQLDYVVVLSGDDLIGVGPIAERDTIVEAALEREGIDPMMDGLPDIVEVALVEDLGDDWRDYTIV